MCGIAGHINFTGGVTNAQITDMSDAIRHRGPDGEGYYLNTSATAGLGHRRLSFLDLSEAGKQPMTNEDGTLWITYNGEVYNYIELREELQKLGHRFHSHSDTEVILHGYEQWGAGVLSKLKGMFAFGIWNEQKRELFLARDRFGIKPLYYYNQNNNFVFASEIKAIKANTSVNTTLDMTSFSDFFVYRYIPGTKSIWNEIKKLPPAHYLVLKANGSVETTRYWSIPFAEKVIFDKEAIEQYDQLLLNSVKTHARSDVPVGSFLSGGYDSSALVYYMSRFGYTPSTFAIGFEGWDVSEHKFAGMVARQYGTNHHDLILESQSLDLLDHLAWVYDEPNGDISIIPTYLVSREARKTVKAVMGGEGADEILVGYQWQKEYKPQSLSLLETIKGLFCPSANPYIVQYYAQAMAMGRFDKPELQQLLCTNHHTNIATNPDWFYLDNYRTDLPDLKRIQQMDIRCFMGEQVLCKVDRASMANSLEVRVPFLDHEICEFVMGLSSRVYYRNTETKHLLYQNLKGHLPAEILERKKQGFVGPDKYYMNMDWYRQRLTDSWLVKDGLINGVYVKNLLHQKDHWRLWKVAVMETWYKRWA
jgi:asparagine synthase (glutamine-hydrolysing)